jgi:hypothetical protein
VIAKDLVFPNRPYAPGGNRRIWIAASVSDGLTTEERDEVRRLRREVRVLPAAITGLSGEEITEPSLDDWSVKDHLAHLAL